MRRLLRDDETIRPIGDVNLMNLVDVTLTLLILFILIAPVIEQGIGLELPAVEGDEVRTMESVDVTVDRAGAVYYEGTAVALDELTARASVVAARRAETDVVILADGSVEYLRIMEVMEALRRGGLTHLSLATAGTAPDGS